MNDVFIWEIILNKQKLLILVSPAVSKLFCIRNKGDQKKRVFILRKINVNLQVLLAANADKILAYRQVLQTDKEKRSR